MKRARLLLALLLAPCAGAQTLEDRVIVHLRTISDNITALACTQSTVQSKAAAPEGVFAPVRGAEARISYGGNAPHYDGIMLDGQPRDLKRLRRDFGFWSEGEHAHLLLALRWAGRAAFQVSRPSPDGRSLVYELGSGEGELSPLALYFAGKLFQPGFFLRLAVDPLTAAPKRIDILDVRPPQASGYRHVYGFVEFGEALVQGQPMLLPLRGRITGKPLAGGIVRNETAWSDYRPDRPGRTASE